MAMQAAARPVHPHMRGVYEGFKLDDTPHYGSSPRAWGLPLSNAEICCDCRSIPTYVGFTSKNRRTASHRSGPSPHTWGLLLRRKRPLDPGRSIPTYVGFTSSESRVTKIPSVHPHIRGVYKRVLGDIGCAPGPSPHTWGLLLDSLQRESQ